MDNMSQGAGDQGGHTCCGLWGGNSLGKFADKSRWTQKTKCAKVRYPIDPQLRGAGWSAPSLPNTTTTTMHRLLLQIGGLKQLKQPTWPCGPPQEKHYACIFYMCNYVRSGHVSLVSAEPLEQLLIHFYVTPLIRILHEDKHVLTCWYTWQAINQWHLYHCWNNDPRAATDDYFYYQLF